MRRIYSIEKCIYDSKYYVLKNQVNKRCVFVTEDFAKMIDEDYKKYKTLYFEINMEMLIYPHMNFDKLLYFDTLKETNTKITVFPDLANVLQKVVPDFFYDCWVGFNTNPFKINERYLLVI